MTNPNKKNTVEISKDELTNLVVCLGKLFQMHNTLIGFYEEESELKKHHRAYLHVREEAEEIIKDDLKVMNNMLISIGSYIASNNSPIAKNGKATLLHECEECSEDEDGEPCVIMSLEDLQAMQQDMIDLTDAIDLMARYYIATKYAAPVNKQHYDDTVHEAKDLADQVFRRWENSTIEEIK